MMLSLKKESGTIHPEKVAAAVSKMATETEEKQAELAKAPKPAVDKVAPAPKPPQLSPKRLLDTEQVRREYRASIPNDVEWDQVLASEFWFAASPKLRAGDIIEIVRDDLRYYGRVIVTQCFGTLVKVHPLEHVEIDAIAPVDLSERSGFRVVDEGLTDKFTIVRISDGQVMARGLETAELAHQQIRDDYAPRYMRRGFG